MRYRIVVVTAAGLYLDCLAYATLEQAQQSLDLRRKFWAAHGVEAPQLRIVEDTENG